MTHLHRIIGYLAATLVELAMAGAWGAAPTVVLDIPTPTATRMTPCPVHAGINIASSSTGDSSSWDQCRIMWQLEADGTALADWPSKYRYVTDPRPGLNNKQIDLAGQTDTDNFNRPRGFNFGWVLTAGTWRVKCTVTNPEGSSTTTTSSDIVVAANTRTQYTVQAAGGDYTTLAACLAADPGTTGTVIAGRNDIEIVVEDGHTENLTAGLTEIDGSNFLIRQAGTGTRPKLTCSSTSVGNLMILDGESFVVEGIELAESTGGVPGGTYSPTGFNVKDTGGFVNCGCDGDVTNHLFQFFRVTAATNGVVVLHCDSDITRGHSWVAEVGILTYKNITITDCDFGYSTTESVVRAVGEPNNFNTTWSVLDNQGVGTSDKSSLRFNTGTHIAAYGNYLTDDNSTGSSNPSQTTGPQWVRTEANYSTDRITALSYFVSYVTSCNNIGERYLELGGDTSTGKGVEFCRFLHNTIRLRDGNTGATVIGARDDESFHADNLFAANLFCHEDSSDTATYMIDVGSEAATFTRNVFPSTLVNLFRFVRTWVGGVASTEYDTLADFNALGWASDNTQTDVTLDGRYEPSSPTTVTTETGVYDDYYGNPRSSTSYAGAVIASPIASKKVMVLQ